MTVSLFDLYSQLRQEGIIFCFSGPASQSVVEGVGDALKRKMEHEDAGSATIGKVFSIFVEQIQNVLHHSDEKIDDDNGSGGQLRWGMVVVGQENGSFYVSSGNYIATNKADELKEQLTLLQSMNKEELKAFFKEQRRRERQGDKKGAGLGFIETARKVSRPLEFEITQVDDIRSFFSIKAVI